MITNYKLHFIYLFRVWVTIDLYINISQYLCFSFNFLQLKLGMVITFVKFVMYDLLCGLIV